MRLLQLARGTWEVLAVLDGRGRCPVLDFLEALEEPYAAARDAVLYLLHEYVPEHGPPKHNEQLSKFLGNGLYEFRRQPKGHKLRVMYFYDEGRRIVCTNAFSKAETTPRAELMIARRLYEEYFQAKFSKSLTVVTRGAHGH